MGERHRKERCGNRDIEPGQERHTERTNLETTRETHQEKEEVHNTGLGVWRF
jgi:hypothetical protein